MSRKNHAPLADVQNKIANRVALHAEQSFAGPNAHPTQERAQHLDGIAQFDPHIAQASGFVAGERAAAVRALPSLVGLAVFAVFLAVGVLANWGYHGLAR
ncbi:MAG TPA: hypothetical protein VHX65_01065 [Pirellulales bacterium]|nr:hypothetical protein [Pirellulales bacterium]